MFKQKKLSLGARFGLIVASFFLGLLLFVSAITTALLADIQIVISEEGISGIVRTMISAPAHVRPKAPATIAGEGGLRAAPSMQRTYHMPHRDNPDDVALDLSSQLIGTLYNELENIFGDNMTFTQEEFAEMVNDSTVKDFIAEKSAGLITDFFNDEITTTFEAEEIVQLITENAEIIETITGAPIPEDIAQQVAQVVDENEIVVKLEAEGLAGFMELIAQNPGSSYDPEAGSDNTSTKSDTNVLEIAKEYAVMVNSIASTKNLITGIAVCVVLMAAIILINCRQLGKGLRRAGYPLMIAGIAVVLNIAAKFQPDLWVAPSELSAEMPWLPLVLKLVRHILLETAVVNIVVFSTGFALFVGGIVLSIVLRPKKNSPVSVSVTAETEELADAVVDETPVEILPEADVAEASEDAPAPIAE